MEGVIAMTAAELWAVYTTLKGLSKTVESSGLNTLIAAINTAKNEAKSQCAAAVSTDT